MRFPFVITCAILAAGCTMQFETSAVQAQPVTSPVLSNPAQWQWSVPVESVVSSETNAAPRAFLWIPPNCQKVRGVVVGQHNMEEEPILEHPKFRETLMELGFAEVWISPNFDPTFNFNKGAGQHFDATMKALADQSGYSELAAAPVVPIGHSAMASYPFNFAAWNPDRTLAAISVSGQWPYYKSADQPVWGQRTIAGVPGLVTMGEYEDAEGRAGEGLKQRQQNLQVPLSMLQEPGAGHFAATDEKVAYLALYIKKAAKYRLKEDGSLRPIDPTKTGYLVDRWHRDPAVASLAAPAAPVAQYTGDPKNAFWFFDAEMAAATEKFEAKDSGKKVPLLGYIQAGQVAEQNPKTHQQVTLKFLPIEDGLTFKLQGTFLETVPAGRPEGWTGLPVGSTIEKPAAGTVSIDRICGPVEKLSDDTFAIRFYRMGIDNLKRTNDIWLAATFAGDEKFRAMVQQSELRFPLKNTVGTPQSIDFPTISDQKVGIKTLPLNATSSAGAKVHYYVQEGPASIEGDTLKFGPIPPRTRFPLQVTVVAWQWGRNIEPKVQSAMPVVRSFMLLDPTKPARPVNGEARASLWGEAKTEADKLAAPTPVETANVVVTQTGATAAQFGRALSFNFCKTLGMEADDLAGSPVRVGNWNNLRDVREKQQTTVTNVRDSGGRVIPNLQITVTGGATAFNSNAFDFSPDASASDNDSRLFNGVYDQNEGTPTGIEISGIPFARYDVVFYRTDDGDNRAGKFQIGNQVLYARGGKANPDNNGANYFRSMDLTLGKGSDIEQGNVVRFENLTGAEIQATFQAVNAGDDVKRNKVAGFQIVERK